METFNRYFLSFSIVIEIVAILGFVARADVLPGAFWAVPLGMALLAGTTATLYWVNVHWARLGSVERVCVFVIAVVPVLPLAAAMAYAAIIMVIVLVAVGAVIAVAVFSLLGGSGSSGPATHERTGRREVTDPYGNRVGWVDLASGEIKDQYGNRLGWRNAETGDISDAYGNRVAWVNPATGEVRDRYGNRLG